MFSGLGDMMFLKSPAQVRPCPTNFSALTTAPNTVGGGTPIHGVAAGQCLAFQLLGPRYAAIEILASSFSGCVGGPCNNSVTFRYKYQTSGTTSLQ